MTETFLLFSYLAK